MATQPADLEGLSILGRPAQPSKKLEAFPNRTPGRYYLVVLETRRIHLPVPDDGPARFRHHPGRVRSG